MFTKSEHLSLCQLSRKIKFNSFMRALFSFVYYNKNRALFFAVLWTLLILGACLIPGREVPNIHIPMMDKWVHFVIFAGFSFLWLCTFSTINFAKMILVFVLSVLLGYCVELLQDSGITVGRSFERDDIIADGIGGFLGVVLFYFLHKRFAKN